MVITAKTNYPVAPVGFLSEPCPCAAPQEFGAAFWWVVPSWAEYQAGARASVAHELPGESYTLLEDTLYFVDLEYHDSWPDFYLLELKEAQQAALSVRECFSIQLLAACDRDVTFVPHSEFWTWGLPCTVNGEVHPAHIEAERRLVSGPDFC